MHRIRILTIHKKIGKKCDPFLTFVKLIRFWIQILIYFIFLSFTYYLLCNSNCLASIMVTSIYVTRCMNKVLFHIDTHTHIYIYIRFDKKSSVNHEIFIILYIFKSSVNIDYSDQMKGLFPVRFLELLNVGLLGRHFKFPRCSLRYGLSMANDFSHHLLETYFLVKIFRTT